MKEKPLHLKRAVFAVLFTLLLSVAGVTNAMAQSFTVGDLTYSFNDDGASVTLTGHVDGISGQLVIPESVELYGITYPVTVIGDNAFRNCHNLTGDLVIPNSVITIGEFAFYYCTGLNGSLTIGDAVQTIQMQAFDNCGFTGTLTIPNAVTYIGGGAFNNRCDFTSLNYNAINCSFASYSSGSPLVGGCPNLMALTIGEDVQVIPDNFLRYCFSIAGDLVIPNSIITIGNNAFEYCYNLTGDLIIPNSVTTIGNSAFNGCNGFNSLTIGNSVTSIGENAFNGCSGFSGSLSIPNAVNTISNSAFNGCNGFDSLTIGNSVTSIGENAFNGCSGFTGSLTIPNTVTNIGNSAFMNCNGFSGTLTLGQFLAEIGNSAFFGACENFTSFSVLAETPPTLGANVFLSVNAEIPVYVTCGTLEAYQHASGWSNFNNLQEADPCQWVISVTVHPTIGGTISGVGTYDQGQTCTLSATPNEGFEFMNWTEDGVVVSTDETYFFTVTGSRNLVAHFHSLNPNIIDFADSNVEAICVANWDTNGDGRLEYDEAATVTDLGDVFQYNENITSFEELQYFTGLTAIGYGAFEHCSNLASIVLPEGITSIGAWAFYACSSLTGDLVIPNSVTTIEYYAFRECTSFNGNLTLGNSLTWIGTNAFDKCNFSGELTIPNTVEYIGIGAFRDCHGFTGTLTIGTGVTKIGPSAFRRCTGITAVQYDAVNWQVIGDYYDNDEWYNPEYFMDYPILNECGNLITVAIGEQVENIPAYAFYHCGSLRGEITLPESLVSVGNYAFAGCDEITTINYNSTNCTMMGNAQYPVFYDCVSIQHINIGENVQSIPNYSFKRCFNVEDISVAAVVPPAIGVSTFASVSRSIPVSVPFGSGDIYRNTQYWEEFFNIIEVYFNDVQVLQLSQGWNWVSIYIEEEDPVELLMMLEDALSDNGIQIESQYDGLTEKIGDDYWWGDLDEVGIMTESMYLIEVAADCTVELEGTAVDPADHEITLYPEWTWIGFPCTEEVDIVIALSGLEAEEGDMIEGPDGVAEYLGGGFWYGIETLVPGQGYMYYSTSDESKTLVFQTGRSKAKAKAGFFSGKAPKMSVKLKADSQD